MSRPPLGSRGRRGCSGNSSTAAGSLGARSRGPIAQALIVTCLLMAGEARAQLLEPAEEAGEQNETFRAVPDEQDETPEALRAVLDEPDETPESLRVVLDEPPVVAAEEDALDEEADDAPVVPEGPAGDAIRTVLGLLALLALAFLAGDPRVQRLEALFGVSQVVAAGLPFFVLGMIAHLPAVSLLTDEVLVELRPLLEFGLGWIGLTAGLQFDARAADAWPRGTTRLTVVLTLVPFVTVAVVFGLVLYGLQIPANTSRLLRDAATFGAAGCLAAPTASALLSGSGLSARAIEVIRAVATLDDIAGVTLLALLSAFYRPETTMVTWALPASRPRDRPGAALGANVPRARARCGRADAWRRGHQRDARARLLPSRAHPLG